MTVMTTTPSRDPDDPETLYRHDFVKFYTDDGTPVTGEVLHADPLDGLVVVRIYRGGNPTDMVVPVPVETADLHPRGRPLDPD